jgi:hypothetical protein
MSGMIVGASGRVSSARAGVSRTTFFAAMAALSLAVATDAQAQARPPPVAVTQFDLTGFLQSATLGGNDVLAGGTLTVNGHLVIVPRNVIVTFPAAFLTWEQMFQQAPPPYGPTQTGMAMSDVPAPFIPYEVHVVGNRVAVSGRPDQYIAGLVSISQQSLNSGQGYINFIDYSTGEMRVGGIMGDPTTGARVRINDPTGKFNGGQTLGTPLSSRLSPDARFSLDSDNPTVKSETGYPMCLPSNPAGDPLCPLANRPFDPLTATFAAQINMPKPTAPGCSGPADPVTGMDPCLMAPLQVGDWITYAGTLVKDGSEPSASPGPTVSVVTAGAPVVTLNNAYVSAWSITANVGIWTAPATDPAYLSTDVTLLGTGGVTALGLAEATIRTRFEGMTTDSFRFSSLSAECQDPAFKKAPGRDCSIIDLYALDLDPCTGDVIGTVDPVAGVVLGRPWGGIDVDQGPPTGAVQGRWRFRPPSRMIPLAGASGVFDPPPHMMRSYLRGAKITTTKNGLLAGQYSAPITEYIFPENAGVGSPIVPNNFESFPFLVNGMGPLAGPGTPIIGPLAPWPGASAPTPTKTCAPPNPTALPVADAGSNQSVVSGALVTLDGSASTDPNGLTLGYAWTAPAGVTLSNSTGMFPTFTAPALLPTDLPVDLTFSLVVSDSLGASAPASVTVTVNPPSTAAALPPIANAGFPQTVASGQTVLLNGSASSDPNSPPQALSFLWTAPAGVTFLGGGTTSTLASPTFVAPPNATAAAVQYAFSLTVTNAPAGLTSTPATVVITVNPAVPPIAILGPNQTVLQGTPVLLDGTGSFDPNGLPITYTWTQVSGLPTITLVPGSTPALQGFLAPNVVGATTFGFTLTVTNSLGLSSTPVLVTVTVLPTGDQVTIVSAVYRIGKQRLQVTATSNFAAAELFLLDPTQPAPASCAVVPVPSACIPLTIAAGVPTAILVGVPEPTTVTVVSNLGGSATSAITRLR